MFRRRWTNKMLDTLAAISVGGLHQERPRHGGRPRP
jgi:hypothetical protein